MRKNILITLILVVLLVGAVGLCVFAPEADTSIPAVSDTVTAPDPNWPTPEEIEKGQEIINQMIEQNK